MIGEIGEIGRLAEVGVESNFDNLRSAEASAGDDGSS